MIPLKVNLSQLPMCLKPSVESIRHTKDLPELFLLGYSRSGMFTLNMIGGFE